MPAGDRLALCVFFEKFDGVADRQNGLGGIVGNFAAELFLKSHHQFDSVETVGAKVIDEAGVLGHLVGLDAEMFHDDFLHALANITHRSNLILPTRPVKLALILSNYVIELADSRGSTPSQGRTTAGRSGIAAPPARVRFGYHTSKRLTSAPARRPHYLYRVQIMAIPPFTCNVCPVM